MTIIHAPHPKLRQPAQAVTTVDTKLIQFLEELQHTLAMHKNPPGVGLAAPQVAKSRRIFVTRLPKDPTQKRGRAISRSFINPRIVSHPSDLTLGPDLKQPILEGCLSIPGLYGPVPRFPWVDLQFEIVRKGQLLAQTERFTDYAARVVQHELDHLDGILFTDYSLKHDLPIYSEDDKGELVEIDKSVIEVF